MKKLLLIISLIYYHSAFSQEMWGIANSNFAGSSGIKLNPTSIMLMPYKWEVTLLSANISVQNNYIGYARNSTSTTAEGLPDPHAGLIDYSSGDDKTANAHIMLGLPSFNFRIKNMAVGFHASARTDLSVRNVPGLLAKFGYEGITYAPLYGSTIKLEGIRMGEMTWAEAGVSLGKQINKNPEKKMMAAVSLNYLAAMQSVSLNVSGGTLGIINNQSLFLNDFSGDLKTAVPANSNEILSFPGRGVSTDIGVCYVSNSNHEQYDNGKLLPMKKYDYRIGLSLIDAGFVTFNGATNYHFAFPDERLDATGTGIDSTLNINEEKGKFTMVLPAALSMQYDRCIKPKIYLNVSLIQRIPMSIPHIDRPNQVSATLRYETTYFEVDLPYSFYDYYLHRFGFAVRYGIIYMGTDKLGAFINNNEINGVDFYFGLRVNNLDFAKRKRSPKKVCSAYS